MRVPSKTTAPLTFVQNKKIVSNPFGDVLADSLEVKEQYLQRKVTTLFSSLAPLNLMDDAVEILAICQEINRYKSELNKIGQKLK
jgi:hypothetical protein